jgi:hypothetical protein
VRNWSPTKIAVAIVLFIVVLLTVRELSGWAREALISFHGGGGGH